jgi:hypothetical protein
VALLGLNAIFTPRNCNRDFITWHAHGFTIHESDGVHISVSADRVAARVVQAGDTARLGLEPPDRQRPPLIRLGRESS